MQFAASNHEFCGLRGADHNAPTHFLRVAVAGSDPFVGISRASFSSGMGLGNNLNNSFRALSRIPQAMRPRLTFLKPLGLGSLRDPMPCTRRSIQSYRGRRHQHVKAVLRPNIAVVGGGHGGLSVALRLLSLPWTRLTRPTVTLIDRADRFTFLPMLYELALEQVEQWEVAPKFSDLLADSSVKFLQGDVENLDLASGAIEGSLKGGKDHSEFRVPFDRLVLALGVQAGGVDKVPGAKEFAIPFYSLTDAMALKDRIASLRNIKSPGEVINIVVAGGSFCGVEIASCLAEDFGSAASVLIVETSDRLLPRGTDFNRRTSEKTLVGNGAVTLYRSRVTEITKDEVVIEKVDGDDSTTSRYPADLVLWTAGTTANAALPNFEVPLDDRGLIKTDSLLQVKDFENRICALGDAAAVASGSKYTGTAQVAVQQAEYAAWNTWASLMGKPKLEYRYVHLGEMMVLGAKNATVTTSVGLELDGVSAWAARRLAYLARMPTDRHRARVAASWAANPLLSGMGDLVTESRKYRTNNI